MPYRADIQGEIVLGISGASLDFSELGQRIPIAGVETTRRGEPITVQIDGVIVQSKRVAPMDRWSYEEKFHGDRSPEETITEFLQRLRSYSAYIRELAKSELDVRIGCFLRSDDAQMGLSLTSEAIALLSEFGVPLELHILSYGLMDNGQRLSSLTEEL